MWRRASLGVLLTICFFALTFLSLPLLSPGLAESDGSPDIFLVKPYLQLGNHPATDPNKSSLEVIWFSEQERNDWKLEWQQSSNQPWMQAKISECKRMGMIGGKPFFRIIADINNLKPGQTFTYRISQLNKTIFQSTGTARKASNQPFRIALAGDIGAASRGEKKVTFEMHKQKPDLLIIPGDIVYPYGRVREYLAKLFPIMNSDQASPENGAPLLRSTPSIGVIGNHDVAMTNNWNGTNLTAFPDALGYFLFWLEPLNGPIHLVNSKNTPYLFGDQANQLSFVKAAGKSYPVMANFSFDYGNSHWLVLDANPYMDWTDKELRKWVSDDLRSAKKSTWKFVCYHQPCFSADAEHCSEQRMRLLCDIFEEQGVDMVFSGHAHDYQRTYPLHFKAAPDLSRTTPTMLVPGNARLDKKFDGKNISKPDGIIYIVTGAGGAHLYPRGHDREQDQYCFKFDSDVYSFTILDIKGPRLTLTQYSDTGKAIDQIEVKK